MKKGILFLAVAGLLSFNASAQEMPSFNIIIKDHKFSPEVTEVPAGQKVKLMVDNQDTTPEEFESSKLRVEKIIKGNSQATILVGPLKAGEYEYVGEFHEDIAKGKIIAK